MQNTLATIDPCSFPRMPISPEKQGGREFAGNSPQFHSFRALWSRLPRHSNYDIRPAWTAYQRGAARMLVRQMYAWRGYNIESLGQEIDDPNRITLTAWAHDLVVATLTISRDSPEGLLADNLYPDELARLRHPERVVCEVSRLAVSPDFRSTNLLNDLFQTALRYGKDLFAASDAVIEVNPRHAPYYKRQMGFRQIGTLRQCQRVNAPAVLLHQTLDELGGVDLAIPGEFARRGLTVNA